MKTYFGVDYRKKFSYGTIMTPVAQITKQGRLANHPQTLVNFSVSTCKLRFHKRLQSYTLGLSVRRLGSERSQICRPLVILG